jgi:hypothetical protein
MNGLADEYRFMQHFQLVFTFCGIITFPLPYRLPRAGNSMMIFYKIKPAKAVRGPIFSQLIGPVVEGSMAPGLWVSSTYVP